MLNLTKVKARLNDVKRKLYYGKDKTISFLDTGKVVATLTDGWFMRTTPSSTFGEEGEYFELSVAQSACEMDLENVIPVSSRIKIDDSEYIIKDYQRPKAATRVWMVKIESNIREY